MRLECYWINMKNCIILCIVLFCCLQGIGQNTLLRADGKEIHTRIVPPEGYARVNVKEGSFGEYLRNLPLRSHGTKVHYFDGREKWNRSVYCAVVDMEIGKRDLQQCADAVIRLQAEYLYKHKAYDRIHFNFTNGFRADYTKWAEGYRISVKGNQVSWYKSKEKDYSYSLSGRGVRLCRDFIFGEGINVRTGDFHADRGRAYSRRFTRARGHRGRYGRESRNRRKVVFAGPKLYAGPRHSGAGKSERT